MMPVLRSIWQVLVLAAFLTIAVATAARAQGVSGSLPPEVLQALSRSLDASNGISQSTSVTPPIDQLRGAARSYPRPSLLPEPPSGLEDDFSRRAGVRLYQYGYDTFANFQPSTGDLQNGAVADNYRLSIGDEVLITLRGQVSRSIRTRIDREGQIVVPDFAPIPAAGRSFGDLRSDIEARVAHAFLNTEVTVSLGEVRQISVAVLGEVRAPGMFHLGGFATLLDALALSGGVRKAGTLRHIIVQHTTGETAVDLYDVISGSRRADLTLQDGDRILVGPVGPTVAVAGQVDRPGIYELPGSGIVPASSLLALGGAPFRPLGNRFLRLSVDRTGRDQTTEYPNVRGITLHAGDILLVLLSHDVEVGSVHLEGHVRVPGVQSLGAAPDVRSLIGSVDNFAEGPYLPFAAIETTDPATRARKYVAVDLDRVMHGEQFVPLRDNDTLIVLGADDVRYLSSVDVQAVLNGRPPPTFPLRQSTGTNKLELPSAAGGEDRRMPGSIPPSTQYALPDAYAQAMGPAGSSQGDAQTAAENLPMEWSQGPLQSSGNTETQSFVSPLDAQSNAGPSSVEAGRPKNGSCRGLQALESIVGFSRAGRFSNAIREVDTTIQNASRLQTTEPCPDIFDRYPGLLPFVLEYAATVNGEVRRPGIYPITSGTSLAALVATAGDITRDADLNLVEITHYGLVENGTVSAVQRRMLQLQRADFTRVLLGPGDVVRFNPAFKDRDNGPVILSGEFIRPGTYDIRRGEHLSEVIDRAGGLTAQAYPFGAVFTRESVKDSEREGMARSAHELESGLLSGLGASGSQQQESQTAAPYLMQLITELRNTQPVGRVVVEADPTVLHVKPEEDVILEPGDHIYMPKRPSFVTVSGEVLNPGSLQFDPDASIKDYIRRAGDYTQVADDDHVFVILPDGRAEPAEISFWNFSATRIPPGSTIIVPRDFSPYFSLGLVTDLSQIFGQLAITGASLAVIGR